ncbi:MAG: T9SS type A sorting domain-containing protein [Ferruginibacter sp.]|nr:T9SS type A sorting domain-containing protein [Ferruginibacter sp.]
MKHFFLILLSCFFSILGNSQCPSGQANITIRVYGDQYVDTENTISCTVNGTSVTLSPASFVSTTTTRWHQFTAPCTTIGGNIVVNLTDGFGDGIASTVGGDNVFVYVNNELVDSLAFTSGSSASTNSNNTAFTENLQPNSTCASAKSNGVAVYPQGGSVSIANSIALNPLSQYGGYEMLPNVPLTQCGTFVANGILTEVYCGIQFTNSPTGAIASAVNPTIKVYNSSCVQVGSDITTSGGTINLVQGQTYTVCGTRYIQEATNWPTHTANTRALVLSVRPLSVMPIKLIEFYGIGDKERNTILWTTTNESKLQKYEVQRSDDGIIFTTISTVKPLNSNNITKYSIVDNLFFYGDNYYRLKIINDDGTFTFSQIITLRNDAIKTQIVNIYPNPIINEVSVQFTSSSTKIINYIITDITGRQVDNGLLSITKGNTKQIINCRKFRTGTYSIKFGDNTNTTIGVYKLLKL